LPPGTSTLLEITVQANPNIDLGTIITNSVTINTNETPPTTTSVDVLVGGNPLNLKKSIVGGIEGQVTQVKSSGTIVYTIDFDNKNYDFPITGINVSDALSEYVTFVSATDENGKAIGKYDEKEHRWTWSLVSLEPKEEIHITLKVSVNPNLPPGTIIHNSVTIECNELLPSTTSVDAIVLYEPIKISKETLDSSGNRKISWINPGQEFIYRISFENNNDSKLTNVSVSDELPRITR